MKTCFIGAAAVLVIGGGRPAHAHEDTPTRYETVVSAPHDDLARSSASETNLDRSQIDALPRRSAEDFLRAVPGAVVVQHGAEGKGQQIYLRGFDTEHGSDIEVTLEGIPLNEPSNVHGHGYLDFSFIPVEALNAIDVVKGPFEAGQGDFATAGSVRLSLGIPSDRRGTWARYTLGSTNRHRISVVAAPVGEAPRSFLAGEALWDAGYGENRSVRRASLLTSWMLSSLGDRAGEVQVLSALYTGRFALPGALRLADVRSGRRDFFDSYTDEGAGRSDRAIVGARHRLALHKGVVTSVVHVQARRLTLRENFTGFLVDSVSGDGRVQDERSLNAGLNTTVSWAPLRWLTTRLGTSYRSGHVDQSEDQVDESGVALQRSRALQAWQHHAALFGELTLHPGSHWQITAGGRADLFHFDAKDPPANPGTDPSDLYVPASTPTAISPRIHAGYSPGGGVTLFGAYGHGLRSPEARWFLARSPVAADASLFRSRAGEPRITVSRTGELGARWQRSHLALGTALFATAIDREMIFDHVAGTNLQRNATRRRGVEVQSAVRLFSGLSVHADGTWTRAGFVASGDAIPGVPRHTLSLATVWNHGGGWMTSLRGYHVGPRPVAHGAMAGGFTLVQAMARWQRGDLEVMLELDNLLDQRWREGEYNFASAWEPVGSSSMTPALHYVAGPPLTARLTVAYRL